MYRATPFFLTTVLLSALLLLGGCANQTPRPEATASAASGPTIEQWTTRNGTRVLFVEARELPMVDLYLMIDAGSARDGERPGLARLTANLLEAGADGLDLAELADRFEQLGAEFSASAGRSSASLSLRSLSDPAILEPALNNFARILQRPDFPEADLRREVARTLVSLRAQRQSPGAVAGNLVWQTLYADHPYAHNPLGSEASLAALGRSDLQQFHARHYTGANSVLAIVGDLDRAAAEAVAEAAVGGLPSGSHHPSLPIATPPAQGEHRVQSHPSAQSHIHVGLPLLGLDDPDHFALLVGNHILGGGSFTSRIFAQVRDQRGLAYSARSSITPLHGHGPLLLSMQTANANADAALELLFNLLDDFITEGPSEAELVLAQRNITGGFALNIDNNRKIVAQVAAIGFNERPLDWLDRYNEAVNAVTVEQIRDAFQRRVDPQRMSVIRVGGE